MLIVANRSPKHLEALSKIGDNDFPSNPLNDRAKGYVLDGKIKSTILNYGNFIDWQYWPAGLWGEYAYLPHVGFIAGVPGNKNTSNFNWTVKYSNQNQIDYWVSNQAYIDWFQNSNTNYVGIAFDIIDDKGKQCQLIDNFENLINQTEQCIYSINYETEEIELYLNTDLSDPNRSNALVGLVFPWALRPKFSERFSDYDLYDYGEDGEEWTDDDNYEYYGYAVSESWFSEGLSDNTDWQPVTKSKENTHNYEIGAGDIFGEAKLYDVPLTDPDDSFPLLAHSKYSETWPRKYNLNTGQYESFWPGWWGKEFYGDKPDKWTEVGISPSNCNGSRKDDDCWVEVPGKFVSDNDIYMEFEDKWAHRGNLVSDNEYIQTGYPLGLKVKAAAHSYGVAYAEDIMFVTLKVRNESGAFYDEEGNFHQGMIMPDGTRLNRGRGFNYKDVYLGFYFDSIDVWADYKGNTNVFTNQDDYMEYYWDKIEHEGDSLLISLAMTYDYDGNSNGATDIGIVATQLLDTPLATKEIDLNKDGVIDIYPGEPLKMTDWHWFDWYNRPGVVDRESGTNCCAGYPGRAQAKNKEEIHYKLMAGDTTNLSTKENRWFFHTANPDIDSGLELNPHFDSLDGLQQEAVFQQDPEGFDCIFIMSCGPFDLSVGEEVPFSFCIIFGDNKEDLITNAEFAQLMYNSNYQGFTAPLTPTVISEYEQGKIVLKWNTSPVYSKDVLTGYSDFEGFNIYKSLDGGLTWGDSEDIIYNDKGVAVGWKPYKQFDLDANQDSLFCQNGFYNQSTCIDNELRNYQISGSDPYAPWFSLGNNSGLPELSDDGMFIFEDTNIVDGLEYTYSITAYDMGISPASIKISENGILDTFYIANPDKWARPAGYQSIESPKGSTINDKNFVTVIAGNKPQDKLENIQVVPNPYVAHSNYNETEYLRKIRFVNLPKNCLITIYTISGEQVHSFIHDNPDDGNAWWDLRTINNQEISPGLYLFSVETENDKYIGKFAVIR